MAEKERPGAEGFNEIRMDDKAGEELFSIQRDYRGVIERDFEATIGRNEKVRVVGNHRTDIVGKSDVNCGSRASFSGPEYYLTTNFTSLAANDQFMITTGTFDTFVQGSHKITAHVEHHYVSDVWQMVRLGSKSPLIARCGLPSVAQAALSSALRLAKSG